jgi:hypothetical protein
VHCVERIPFTSSLAWNFVEPISCTNAPGSRVHEHRRKRWRVGPLTPLAVANCSGVDSAALRHKFREVIFGLEVR